MERSGSKMKNEIVLIKEIAIDRHTFLDIPLELFSGQLGVPFLPVRPTAAFLPWTLCRC